MTNEKLLELEALCKENIPPAGFAYSSKGMDFVTKCGPSTVLTLLSELKEARAERDHYKSAIKKIAAVTYGTEPCNSKEENSEILVSHFFAHQNIAREALAGREGERG
jgi:hypothetical protein